MSTTPRDVQETFFRMAFGNNSGYVGFALLSASKKQFTEHFFSYPEQLPEMLTFVSEHTGGFNVYFCPQLLSGKRRDKTHVKSAPSVWADLDTCPPEEMLLEPTLVVESSPKRYQALWCFDHALDPDDAEELSKRIAYRHAESGADKSGWDLTQLLRVPETLNYKYPGHLPTVKVHSATRNLYRFSDFDVYEKTTGFEQVKIPIPHEADLPESADDLLQEKRLQLNPKIWELFSEEPKYDWSRALWNLQMLLFEAGFDRNEVFVISREARCNKYARDGRPQVLLWKEVCRAESKSELHHKLLVPDPQQMVELMSEEEKALVNEAGETFVERYCNWAKGLGDAAPQYHQAGAFICLSSLLCGSVRLPTSYGNIVPNLWFMILADTTLTRKTTSMDIAMDLLEEIDPELIMATDGSLEGLLASMSTRPGRPSIFLRDEFSGLIEQMTKKDYMAGMPELLTKLYDGKMQKRILRKETIEVRDPRLIVFAGGIRNKITSLLNYEHVSSGFMPRFIYITAESDINRLKPIGPPSVKTTGVRDAILNELQDLYQFYNRQQEMSVKGLSVQFTRQVVTDAELSEEAWFRYNQLETKLLEIGLQSEHPEIMTPVGDRLSKSILKAAVLLAASRQQEEVVKVELIDILRAIKYGQQWREHAAEIMGDVGKGQTERTLDTVMSAIRREDGISRSKIMQKYRLRAYEANQIFDTLEQRGLVRRQKTGRTETLYATE